ncbi:MAG TPA: isochorismatase family protein [Mycobacteriales bacterium]|nr:isochorismatase family protein [Mycobacteriales bacterium]
MSHAVIVVDVQNDFCEGGALAVAGGADVASAISAWLPGVRADHVVATRDHHIDPGAHFSDHPNYVDSWPRHCVAGTPGEQLHPNLVTDRIEAVFDKGQYDDGYSGFLGATEPAELAQGDRRAGSEQLAEWLRERGVTTVEIVGIATDHCVRATALDAAREGFETTVRLDLTAGVAEETTEKAVESMRAAGVALTGLPVVRQR